MVVVILMNPFRNTVKTFYTAGLMVDILDQFDQLDDEFKEKRKYAKWKAAHIHNCLKHGETPISGPRNEIVDDDAAGTVHKNQIQDEDVKGYSSFGDPSGK